MINKHTYATSFHEYKNKEIPIIIFNKRNIGMVTWTTRQQS